MTFRSRMPSSRSGEGIDELRDRIERNFVRIAAAEPLEVGELSESTRGDGGFGSSGR